MTWIIRVFLARKFIVSFWATMEPSGETTDPGQPARETAVIFAELLGAPELYALAGDAAGQEAIQTCADALRKVAEGVGARVVKRIGGRLMIASPTADGAARAAVETASKSLRDLRVAEVVRMDVTIDGGGVALFRTRLNVSFKYESD
jgi:flavin-binding protein dodecin